MLCALFCLSFSGLPSSVAVSIWLNRYMLSLCCLPKLLSKPATGLFMLTPWFFPVASTIRDVI